MKHKQIRQRDKYTKYKLELGYKQVWIVNGTQDRWKT